MSRIRFILLGLLAAVAAYAVGPAAASAEQKICKEGLPHLVFCYDNGVEIGTPTQAVTGTSGVSILTGVVLGLNAKIECKKDTFTGKLELLGANSGKILFEECKWIEPQATKCALAGAHVTANVVSRLVGTMTNPEVLFTAPGGEANTIAEFEVVETAASCTVKGPYQVSGEEVCELPEGGVSKVEHEIKCTKAKALLKLGGNAAGFSSKALIHLTTTNEGLGWFVGLGT
jgi:hypothetical protein